MDHAGRARRRDGAVPEPCVPAAHGRSTHRSRAGRRASALARRGAASRSRKGLGVGAAQVQRSRAEPSRVPGSLDRGRRRRDEDVGRQRLSAITRRDRRRSPRDDRRARSARRHAMTTVLTPANQLTLLGMLLIPLFGILQVYGYLGWALAVFIAAGITDALDGLIARWSGQKTTVGAWLDPMADKLLLVTTFVVLTLPWLGLMNAFPVWLTVLIISRDVGIVLTVAIVNLAVGPRTFRPSMLGKAATATYIVTAVAALFFNYLGYRPRIFDAFIYAALGITLASGLDYIWHA